LKAIAKEIEELDEEEKTIQIWIEYLQNNMNEMYEENHSLNKYAYLTFDDFKEISDASKVIRN
jgi:transcription factor E2F3